MGIPLIARDKTFLEETEGKALVDEDLPESLKTPRVVPLEEVRKIEERNFKDDLIISNAYDAKKYIDFLTSNHDDRVHALWSGYRSCLVFDQPSQSWYRLKGVSLNPRQPEITEFEDNVFWIQGGQKLQNAWYEKSMANRFNRVLENEGIQPVMEPKGIWKYPVKVRSSRLAASIYQVQGDTRLDEFMFVLENLFIKRIHSRKQGENYVINEFTEKGKALFHDMASIYSSIGGSVGRLKKLMDKNGQTWSCDSERSNAHIGNVVLYGNPFYKLYAGLVDFDASCDSSELTKSELEDIQKKEYETIVNSAGGLPISLREIGGFLGDEKISGRMKQFREQFVKGFQEGYNNDSLGFENCNEMFFSNPYREGWQGTLNIIFEILRSNVPLSYLTPERPKPQPKRTPSHTESLDEIIRRSYGFEKIKDKIIEKGKDNILNKDNSYRRIGNYTDPCIKYLEDSLIDF